jgi:hypothetical protein
MVAELQIPSSGISGLIQDQNNDEKNKGHPNILGVASAHQSSLKRATIITWNFARIIPGEEREWFSYGRCIFFS